MDKLSLIIPARDCPFLKPTVDDIFKKATGDIEVIVMLDGCWPNPKLDAHKNLTIVHTGTVKGMRTNINAAARIASGKYIMKCDDHCMFGMGFDEILKADCEPDWLAVPSRYGLDPGKWKRGKGPIDYLTLTYPFIDDEMYGKGFHGKNGRANLGSPETFGILRKNGKRY